MRANESLINLLTQIQKKVDLSSLPQEGVDSIELLKQYRIISEEEGFRVKPPPYPPNDFHPTAVTLFPSFDCNLRCLYCYSYGGESVTEMPMNIAMASIDFICDNAKHLNKKKIKLSFHGGGEPTINWRLFQDIIKYGQEKARALNLKLSVSM